MARAVETVVRAAYADATGRIFFWAGVIALVTIVAVALMPVTELRSTIRKVTPPPAELARTAQGTEGRLGTGEVLAGTAAP